MGWIWAYLFRWGKSCPTRGRKKTGAAQRNRRIKEELGDPTNKIEHASHVACFCPRKQATTHMLNCLLVWHLENTSKVVTQDHNNSCTGSHFALIAVWDAHGKLPWTLQIASLIASHCWVRWVPHTWVAAPCPFGPRAEAPALAAVAGRCACPLICCFLLSATMAGSQPPSCFLHK